MATIETPSQIIDGVNVDDQKPCPTWLSTNLGGCMKNLIARTLMSVMFVAVVLVATVPAQSIQVLKVNIPFEFSFGDHNFPAGQYSLVQPRPHFLELRDSREHFIAQVLTGDIYSRRPATSTKLNFYSSDGRHILAEVWERQESSGEQLYQPKPAVDSVKRRSTADRDTAQGGQLKPCSLDTGTN
jgi:hypothetical protein